jgi:dihydrofolate reductase
MKYQVFTMQKISLIAAMSDNRVIGYKNKLPWHMPADWRHFRKITHGKAFIMGRNSYEAPDKLLSTKLSIILSRHDIKNLCEKCIKAENFEKAVELLKDEPEVFILGGQSVFEQALKLANYIYLTIIHGTFQGDAYFPEFDRSSWKLVRNKFNTRDDDNPFDYTFQEFERI